MQDCTKDEFIAFMSLLSGLKIAKLVSGQQVLAEIITEQAELDKPFDVGFCRARHKPNPNTLTIFQLIGS